GAVYRRADLKGASWLRRACRPPRKVPRLTPSLAVACGRKRCIAQTAHITTDEPKDLLWRISRSTDVSDGTAGYSARARVAAQNGSASSPPRSLICSWHCDGSPPRTSSGTRHKDIDQGQTCRRANAPICRDYGRCG